MSDRNKDTGEKLLGTNPKATQNYFIDELLEAGIVLTGTEIKSLRQQSPNLRDAYVDVRSKGGTVEAWLLNAHFSPYSHGNIWNHEATRKRKLLLHQHQLAQMFTAVTQKGLSIFPTRMYLKKGFAKVELGIGKGKKRHDKRETLKKKSAEREMDQIRKKRL